MQPLRSVPLAPHDPAPSRWAYRMHRLWLTPLFRAMLRVGLPSFTLIFSIGLYLSDDQRRASLNSASAGIWEAVQERPEFMVNLLAIDGASPALSEAVRAKLALTLPASSLQLDMAALKLKAEELDAVATAELRVRTGGVLQVTIQERVPVIIWRTESELSLLDASGTRVARIFERADRPDLPIVTGQGANDAVAEALALIAAAEPIASRLRGLVRVGERRWDMVLDRDQRILLPEVDPIPALERVIALDKAEKLLDRDVVAVDFRNEHRPVLRLTPGALEQMRNAGAPTETGASNL
ncbi:cell division protein FtsQ/DivIB [Tabrizicola sp. J26]|uniref:cell division protein FtsQ/DivIB n=1 Tax=Alitabrizicola rongguiensis TaxID=2909234 RepID=UPI001F1A5073|nr:cell division protein FtsQ/DivIB [Tabrizicola rongguiensis]MCF1707266.1 cell division protein FtsQ/DivIB [Tabrizicola rongguiensis]